jgi:hypothetical protein
MLRHILGGFEGAAVLQKHRGARAPESVIADALREFGGGTAFFDYAKHIALGNGLAGELVIRERQEVGGQAA